MRAGGIIGENFLLAEISTYMVFCIYLCMQAVNNGTWIVLENFDAAPSDVVEFII